MVKYGYNVFKATIEFTETKRFLALEEIQIVCVDIYSRVLRQPRKIRVFFFIIPIVIIFVYVMNESLI